MIAQKKFLLCETFSNFIKKLTILTKLNNFFKYADNFVFQLQITFYLASFLIIIIILHTERY